MIVISNCLTENTDEGCLKVAVNLIRRMKKQNPQTVVVGYERRSPLCDEFLQINKLMLNKKLIRILRRSREPVLFAPFSAKMRSTALRTWIISLFARGKVFLLQPMHSEMTPAAKIFLKFSGARMLLLSHCSWQYYSQFIGDKAVYLKTGVDTQQFTPCTPEEKISLRKRYGIGENKPVVLHVGHMKTGRNVGVFEALDPRFHGVLVVSTHNPDAQDSELRRRLSAQENLTLLEGYLPAIEDIYRLADVYLFPVEEKKSCIDVPLSVLEAAACGIPVVTTPFREMKVLADNPGFYVLQSFADGRWNDLLQKAVTEKKNPRAAVLDYDWDHGARLLQEI